MKKTSTLFITLCCAFITTAIFAQAPTPEVLYYRFEGSGTTIPNEASNPPAGTTTATIVGSGMTQGSNGLCGGALIGTGTSSSTDYVNTGWAPSIGTGSWTLSFWTSNIVPSTTLWYILGDINTSSLRCFTNGVAGPNNWILRGGGLTDVYINGGATVAPHLITFVYDNTVANVYGYLDGVLVTTVAQGAVNITGSGPFKVGAYSSSSNLNGLMDEFRFYSRALTAAEVATLMTPATYSTIAPNTCGNYISPAGNTYTTTGTYTDTIPNSGGCDSIITINLTVNTASTNSFASVACGSYTTPSGAMITSSGTYMDTIPNVAGCDSVMTINVTILQPTSSTINPSACVSYTAPSGAVYSASGTYTDIIPNTAGCDSTITINLTINSPSSSSFAASACDTYTAPSGAMYTTSGTYTDIIPNAMGCDSVMTIAVTITNSTSSTITTSNCDSYTAPSGAVYSTSGTYTDIIPNMAGCDSVITIDLTIMNSTTATQTISSCGPYTAPSGAVLSASGTYTDIIPNMAGCDSTITINLTVNTVNASATQNGSILTASANGATYQWINCSNMQPIAGATSQSYTATSNGSYAVIVTQNSCTDTSACMSVTGIGIAEHNFGNAVSLYPNPNEGNFNIDLGATYTNVNVIITDVAGRVIFTQHADAAQLIPVQMDAAAGMYTIQLISNDQRTVLHFVKD